MFPYEKQNLVPYRDMLIAMSVGFVGFLLGGVLFQKPTGAAFLLTLLFSAVWGPGRALFGWQAEPTAKRQLGAAIVVMIIVGILGTMAIDSLLALYHLSRDECPAWLDVSGRCQTR